METYSGFSHVADRGHFIVAYPSSAGLYWNSNGVRGLPDDVRFLGRLISALEQRLCVDSTRLYATGVSNGVGMVALAGCELSRQLTAIAPVAGGYDGQPACRPARPLSVLEIHGTADQVVPYFGAGRRPTRNGLPPYVNAWAKRDRCRGSATVRRLATRTVIYRWSACEAGVTVEHIRIARGRHQWPGATPPDPGPPSTFCGACTIWRFFESVKP
jgi:polyhydroxybutyrate depolymerase